MLMVFHFGMWRVPNSMVSTTSLSDGSGGKRNSFCAIYSLRMSFCSVPPSFSIATPCFSAAAMYIAQMAGAGLLIVIEVVWPLEGHARLCGKGGVRLRHTFKRLGDARRLPLRLGRRDLRQRLRRVERARRLRGGIRRGIRRGSRRSGVALRRSAILV